ncbi:MAG: hypothetical protein JO000_12855 [Alphaproteobacteria bacterium]|nr:hypothetical protein [Alphaproteobacteria bacterium]
MTQRLPLLIGISGKRKFDKDDADRDRAISAAVAARLRRVFEQLDRDLPETPKVVLTGAAFGADMIAAHVAYAMGPDWGVVAILPFGESLFAQDFVAPSGAPLGGGWDDRYREHANSFAGLLALAGKQDPHRPRLIVRELPPLQPGGAPVTNAQLSRTPGTDRSLRHQHYEQVGQFIAESATIMIAVMDADEQPTTDKADGGTARVAACRSEGRPDIVGMAVASDSIVLRRKWSPLVRPPGGFVWIIDPGKPADETAASRCSKYPVRVLPPAVSHVLPAAADNRLRTTLDDHEPEHRGLFRNLALKLQSEAKRRAAEESKQLRASLSLARGLEQFNALSWRPFQTLDARAVALAQPADITLEIAKARSVVSEHQGKANDKSKAGFKFLAGGFVVAVLIFEIYAKFAPDNWLPLALYLLTLGLIGFTAFIARLRKWQPVAEDYRAVAEMLRVQRAWWSAGLTERVDREHLEGVDDDLARVRDGTRTIIAWLLLRQGWTTPVPQHWEHVRGTATAPRNIVIEKRKRSDKKNKKEKAERKQDDWIGGQTRYFKDNAAKREERYQRSDAASWTLFVASGWLAVILCLALADHHLLDKLERVAVPIDHWLVHIVAFVIWIALACGLVWFRVWNRDLRHYASAASCTLVVALLAAGCLALAILSTKPLLDYVFGALPVERHMEHVEHAMVVVLITLSAFAGAWRYLIERLNVEAEALEYRDARRRFERAEHLLCVGADPGSGRPADLRGAQQIVLELGRLALTENEAWLKSRRERPLTPVVG